jgi:hypothetical protein
MVYPFTQTAEPALAVGFIATNYRYHHHVRKGLIALAPATFDGTARAWRSAYPSIPGVDLAGKGIAFCLALLLMGFSLFPQMGKLKPGNLGNTRINWERPG